MHKTGKECELNRRDFVRNCSVFLAAGAVPSLLAAQQPPSSAGPVVPELIEDLVAANRVLAAEGVVDGYGHVSARHDRDPNRYLLSRSLAPELVTAADIMEFDLDSVPVDPQGRGMYLERFIHGEIYKVRPDVKAIVHNHSPSVIPFGISTVPLQPVYHMAAFIAEGVPVFEIREAGGMTNMLVRNPALAESLARTLDSHPAILMRGHGAVVVGPGVRHAVGRSVYLQMNARLQSEAVALGGPVTYLHPEEAAKREADLIEDGYSRSWELWKKKALAK